MFEKVLSKSAKESLAILSKSRLIDNAYLAGGTAVALQLGHRESKDFDFFTPQKFGARVLAKRIKKEISSFKIEKISWGTIMGFLGDVRFTMFFYEYPLLFKPNKFLGINIADVRDITPMKIAAISDRGTKRDFVDLYFIFKKKYSSLEESLNLYERKFRKLKQNKFHLIKSLTYFRDAEEEEMPKMLVEVNWPEIKRFFEKEVKKLSKVILE